MREIFVATFISLDGVMQAPGGPDEDRDGGFAFGGWNPPYFDAAVGEAIGEGFAKSFDLLLGRKTYDIFAAHWPRVASDTTLEVDEGEREMARTFDACTKYVASRTRRDFDWVNTIWLGEDPVASLREIKAGEGPTLLVQGSSEFLQTLFAADLVDRLQVLVFPVLLGRGKRLFAGTGHPGALKLVRSTTSPSGVIIASYVRDGDVRTGSFALK